MVNHVMFVCAQLSEAQNLAADFHHKGYACSIFPNLDTALQAITCYIRIDAIVTDVCF